MTPPDRLVLRNVYMEHESRANLMEVTTYFRKA